MSNEGQIVNRRNDRTLEPKWEIVRLVIKFELESLHTRLKEQGYVIYAGQGNLENKIFRVANMGHLTEAQFTAFLDAFEQVCKLA